MQKMIEQHSRSLTREYPFLPTCDHHSNKKASFEFKDKRGIWHYGCRRCFSKKGIGIGKGRGYQLIVEKI